MLISDCYRQQSHSLANISVENGLASLLLHCVIIQSLVENEEERESVRD